MRQSTRAHDYSMRHARLQLVSKQRTHRVDQVLVRVQFTDIGEANRLTDFGNLCRGEGFLVDGFGGVNHELRER